MIPEKLIEKGIYWSRPWSLIDGCTPVSESCQNCWLAAMEYRFDKCPGLLQVPDGLRIPRFNGNIILHPDRLDIPRKTKKPQVFAIWSDLFHGQVKAEFIRKTYQMMSDYPQHIFLVLTKRAERLRTVNEIILRDFSISNMSHIWHGCTAENQQRADERIPYLLQVPGKRLLSLEPLLDAIDLHGCGMENIFTKEIRMLDQIIVGAESGPRRRPCKIEWIKSIVQQCKAARVPCFVKQIHINGKVVKDINKFPEDLRVRELAWLN